MRYGPPPKDLPGQVTRIPGPDRETIEAAARRMSQGSERPVLLPDDSAPPQDVERTIVRARQSTKRSNVNRRQQGIFFFIIAED